MLDPKCPGGGFPVFSSLASLVWDMLRIARFSSSSLLLRPTTRLAYSPTTIRSFSMTSTRFASSPGEFRPIPFGYGG